MHNSSVQFRGIESIIEAYDNCKIPAWAFLQGKGIIASYAGDDMDEGRAELDTWMHMLKKSRSTAVYALQLYRKPGEDIDNKTCWNNRFQCTLYDEDTIDGYRGSYNRVKELEAQLAAKEEEEEDREDTFMDKVGAIIQKPEVQQFLLGHLVRIISGFRKAPGQPASMAGVPKTAEEMNQDEANAYNNLSPDQQEKVTRAMAVLMAGDPAIGTNLLKLATLLQTDPAKYNMLSGLV